MGHIDLPGHLRPRKFLAQIEKDRCENSLAYFIRAAWHVVEPAQPYVEGWHVAMMAKHLEAITDGVEVDGKPYNRLLINVPPGMMKSLCVAVFWAAWEWGPRNMPHLRYLCASHSQSLSIRDSMRMRRLITSEWYQKHWGDRVQLTGDQNSKIKFENTATGFREAVAAASITGVRADRVIIDDPHSVEGASSEQMRQTTLEWFSEAVPLRLNNPILSAIVVIMQRLHEDDVSGMILDRQLGYDYLMLPMRFDVRRACKTALGYSDPRTEEGELLFPERFPIAVVERDESVLGLFATAGQMQQEPVPRGGGIIKDAWWQLWAEETFPLLDYILAYLDTAYTEKEENDPSALVIFGVFTTSTKAQITKTLTRYGSAQQIERVYAEGSPNAILMYAFSERLEFAKLVERVTKECQRFKVDKLMIENKAAGISVAQEMRRVFGDESFMVQLDDPKSLDKVARLHSVQQLFVEGMIWAPDKDWAEATIREVTSFPKGRHDDRVDCVSGALRHLRSIGLLTRAPERLAEIEASRVYQRAPEPLYPG